MASNVASTVAGFDAKSGERCRLSSENVLEDDAFFGFEIKGVKRILEEREDDQVILDPIEDLNKKWCSPRKRAKRRILIDVKTSLDRDVIVDNITHPNRFLSQPVYCQPDRKQMAVNRSLFDHPSGRELTPALDELFLDSVNSHKLFAKDKIGSQNTSAVDAIGLENEFQRVDADVQDNETSFQETANCIEMSPKADEVDLSVDFIPLHDEEYSSDEDESFSAKKVEDMSRDSFNQNTTITDEGEPILNEDIIKDKFCSFVETKVTEARGKQMEFHEIVCSDGSKTTRKLVARRFLKCLLMQRDSRLCLEQDESFGKIILHPGAKAL